MLDVHSNINLGFLFVFFYFPADMTDANEISDSYQGEDNDRHVCKKHV